jgi:hypothetical protein
MVFNKSICSKILKSYLVLAACAETAQRMRMRPVKKDMSVLHQCAEQSHALALSFNILYDSISTELFIRGIFLFLLNV